MKKKFLFAVEFIIVLLSLLSCSNQPGKWLNTNIAGNYLPHRPSLQDDFYQHVNYNKLLELLPENYNQSSYMDEASENIQNQMFSILKNKNPTNNKEEQILIDLYNQFMNWDERNANGLNAVIPLINKFRDVKTIKELENLYSDEQACYFFPFYVSCEGFSPVIFIQNVFLDNKDACIEFYSKMMIKIGYSEEDAKRIVSDVFDFEKEIYTQTNDDGQSINFIELDKKFPKLHLAKFITDSGNPKNSVYYINSVSNLEKLDFAYCEKNLELIKNHAICRILYVASLVSDKESFELVKSFYKNANVYFNYINDDLYVFDNINTYAPMLLGKIWFQRFFSDEIKNDITGLTRTILNEYKNIVQSWDWISESSRYTESVLLNNIIINVGYANNFEDYSNLDLCKDNLFETYIALRKNKNNDDYAKIWKYYENNAWIYPPQCYNAYYSVGSDTGLINIYAGYICGEKYSVDLPLEEKLAKLGVTIAHEISHSFTYYNGNETLLNQWKSEDLKTLRERMSKMVDYLNSIEVINGKKCNGDFVIGEMSADLYGMYAVLNIAHKYSDFDYDLFFRTYAQTMYTKMTPAYVEYYNKNINHAMYYLRVNTVLQQFEDFYRTYNIKKGDGMYLSPKKRIKFTNNDYDLLPLTNYEYSLQIDELNKSTLPYKLFSNSLYNLDLNVDTQKYTCCKIDIFNNEGKKIFTKLISPDYQTKHFIKKIYTDYNTSKMIISLYTENKYEEYISFELIPVRLKESRLSTYDSKTKITTFTIDYTNIHSFPKTLIPGRVYTFDIDLHDFGFNYATAISSGRTSRYSGADCFTRESNGHFVKTVFISEADKSFAIDLFNSDWFESYKPIVVKIEDNGRKDKLKLPKSYKKAHSYLSAQPDNRIIDYLNEIDACEICKTNPDRVIELCAKKVNEIAKNDFEKIVLLHDAVWYLVRYDGNVTKYQYVYKPAQDYVNDLQTGLCVCEGFGRLFFQMCYVANIPCMELTGFGIDLPPEKIKELSEGDVLMPNHMWNMVMAENSWYFVDFFGDCRVDSFDDMETRYSSKYLFTYPSTFLLNHYPDLPECQLIKKPLTPKQYVSYIKRGL